MQKLQNQGQNEENTNNEQKRAIINKMILIIVCSILPLLYLYGVLSKYLIQHHGVYTKGVIVGNSSNSKGNLIFHYEFYVEGKKYTNTSTYLNLYNNAKNGFVGKSFPVVYYPQRPGTNFILITPNDFKYIDEPFPDSLKWVLIYVND